MDRVRTHRGFVAAILIAVAMGIFGIHPSIGMDVRTHAPDGAPVHDTACLKQCLAAFVGGSVSTPAVLQGFFTAVAFVAAAGFVLLTVTARFRSVPIFHRSDHIGLLSVLKRE